MLDNMSMSEKRTARDEGTTTRASDVIDAVRDNTLRIVDEAVKLQPQFSQSLSNLQLDSIKTVRSLIQTAFANQKQFASTLNIPQVPQVSEQIVKQSTEITNDIVRSIGIFGQLGTNTLNAAREHVNICNKTLDAVVDFNNNIVSAWTSFWSAQQQQFFRA
jgi:hypothetical protein